MSKLLYSGKLVLIVCLMSVLFVACGGDSNKNELVLNGDSFSLDKGTLESYGENSDGSFDWDINLASSGVTINQALAQLEGNGTIVYLDLNTNSETGLVDGTYNFGTDRNAFIMVDGDVGIDIDLTSQVGTISSVTAGSVTIAGDKIDFDLTLANGDTAVGNYTGSLTRI